MLRLQLPISMPGLGHVNCYAMEDSDGVALVDPGLPGPGTWRHLKRRLADAGLPIERVHTVVVTHSHPDHFGQAERLRKRFGADIVTHESFRTFLDPQAEADDHDVYTVLESSPDHDRVGFDPNDAAQEAAIARPASVDQASGSPFSRTTPWGGKPFPASPLPPPAVLGDAASVGHVHELPNTDPPASRKPKSSRSVAGSGYRSTHRATPRTTSACGIPATA